MGVVTRDIFSTVSRASFLEKLINYSKKVFFCKISRCIEFLQSRTQLHKSDYGIAHDNRPLSKSVNLITIVSCVMYISKVFFCKNSCDSDCNVLAMATLDDLTQTEMIVG